MKSESIKIRISKSQKAELTRLSEMTGKPVSLMIRSLIPYINSRIEKCACGNPIAFTGDITTATFFIEGKCRSCGTPYHFIVEESTGKRISVLGIDQKQIRQATKKLAGTENLPVIWKDGEFTEEGKRYLLKND